MGAITFLSPVWGGRASDVKIVRESGFISRQYHMPGDQILADRGFTLHDDFATVCGAELGKWQKTAYCQRGGVISTTGISTNAH